MQGRAFAQPRHDSKAREQTGKGPARGDPFDRRESAHRTPWHASSRGHENRGDEMQVHMCGAGMRRTMLAWQRGRTPFRSAIGRAFVYGHRPTNPKTIILPKRRQPAAASRFSRC